MSFDVFAKMVAGTPENAAGAAARAAELARKPFAEAFVSEVYPHWQGPLKTMSGKPGVESVTHGHVAGFLPVESMGGISQTLETPLLSEVLTVTTHVGVRAVVAYIFAGDVNDGVVKRVAGYAESGALVLATEGQASPLYFARGPLAALVAALEADVQAASALFGHLLVAGLDARLDRLAREEAAKEAAEKARAEAEQKAKDEAAAAEKLRIEAEAAEVRARKGEEESAPDADEPTAL